MDRANLQNMKVYRKIMIVLLAFVVLVTAYYSIVRFIVNNNERGINPWHILYIGIFLVLPLSLGIYLTRHAAKKKKRKK